MSEFDIVFYSIHSEVIKDLGIFALQSLIAINAGAIIALLTFIPQVASLRQFNVDLRKVILAVWCFLIGLFLAFLSIGITYVLSQMKISGATLPAPFWFVFYMMFPAFLSFLFFSIGSSLAIVSILGKK